MTPTLTTRLCTIALKPSVSPSTSLITTRRILRRVVEQLDSIHAERRMLRRKAAKLKAFLPFTQKAIEDLETQAREHREDSRSGASTVLAGFGQSVMFDRDGLTAALGFDRMCELLGVNPVHRQQAHRDGDTTLRGLAFMSRLEDSAAGYGDDWGAGGPLFRACHAALVQFIRECPEGQLPNLFEPGAPFGQRLPPSLTIVTP